MEQTSARETVGRIAEITAGPWVSAFWFGFTYLPPASLVGREAV
jgi:hypothetical protein